MIKVIYLIKKSKLKLLFGNSIFIFMRKDYER